MDKEGCEERAAVGGTVLQPETLRIKLGGEEAGMPEVIGRESPAS